MNSPRREFDGELQAIDVTVAGLFGMVVEGLSDAARALLEDRADVAETLAARDRVVDGVYLDIEALVNRQILLQAPVARDLRFLLSALRVVPELERSHDLVAQIAFRALGVPAGELSPAACRLVRQMSDLASAMWRAAADAWYWRDGSRAAVLDEDAGQLRDLRSHLDAELVSGRMPVPVSMEMTLVTHAYDRLGAHAVNIARRVGYLAGRQAA
jgi:phosphate transport system protein